MSMTYREQLLHPNWQRKRLEMLNAAGWECSNCGRKETTLHVHHRTYLKGRMAWEYSAEQLAVLCEVCHDNEHVMSAELKELLSVIDTAEALALLRGFHVGNDDLDPWIGDAGRDSDPHTWAIGIIAALLQCAKTQELGRIAEFVVSMSNPHTEARQIHEKYSDIFSELG